MSNLPRFYRFSVVFLLFSTFFLEISAKDNPTRGMRRGQREKCRTLETCVQFCEKLKMLDRIPICFQHRCWCATPDSPLIAPMSYYTTTPEPETTETVSEGSGDAEIVENAENPERKPIEFNILDYIKNVFLTGPETENGF